MIEGGVKSGQKTASQASTPTDTAIVPSQADPATISKKAKAKAELQKFKNDLRKEKILEQEERLKMLIAQVLSQNPRSPLSIDEIYGIWETQKCRRNYRSGFRGNN